ncbi:hypothetical protein FLACOL7796_04263 [Flavobacterium collinsii]|uniref:Uncharacterized protein n=1 Tax=Flavobacterium collinsii TaxID=1114861 RepID=A0ABN7ES35_9FLAO|nr:hypothetical protein FLACOL7796_04263 [Flavobacterium collinsii]
MATNHIDFTNVERLVQVNLQRKNDLRNKRTTKLLWFVLASFIMILLFF